MAMENKRIIQLSTERTNLTSGDYVMVDSDADGSAKYRLERLKETDTTLSVSGMAADAAATGRAISDEAEARENADTALGDEVSDLKSAIDNYLYGTSVVFNGIASQINKFSLKMFEGQTYTVTNGTSAPISVVIWRSDGTKKTISGNLASGATVSFVPDAQDYITFGGWVNSAGNIIVTCSFSSFDKLDDLETATSTLGKTVITVSRKIDGITTTGSIPATATQHENQFYNINNAFYDGNNQWDYYTVSVVPGDTFTIDTVAGGTVRGWAFRDSSDNQLSIASYYGDVVQKEYTNVVAPENATVLIVNFKHVSGYLTIQKNGVPLLDVSKIYYDNLPLSYYLDRYGTNSWNILYGKTLVCCGDSITYGADMTGDELVTPEIESYQYSAYTKKWTKWTADEPAAYGYQIAARNGMIFYNGGVSGACVQGSGGTSTVPGFSVADGEYTLLPDNIDYMTLFFGWNDTATGTLGTFNDTTNDSYYGGYNVVLPYLINKYPYTKIALIVPFGTDVGHRKAIRDLANKWGVACFDMYKAGTPLYWGKEPGIDIESSIVTANREKFSAQANSPHPNIHGHYQISTMLEQFLRGI